jgi:mannitol/fructose-specific phosphotransferase system IIA component (Ntr-type)
MAGTISSLLDPSRIALKVQSTQRTAALNEVARLVAAHPAVTNFDGFYRELLARDRLETTCIGHGVALPHARTEHVNSIALVIGRSDTGIHFGDKPDENVRLLFMLGTPKTNPGDYLAVVSALCKLLKAEANRTAFFAAATPEEFIAAVVDAESKLVLPAGA